MNRARGIGFALLLAPLLIARTAAQAPPPTPAPEAATGRSVQHASLARHDMVVAANPLAAAAGREVLRQGGTAVDAAIATQLVLNLVEPQSSGIGGGAFLLFWSAAERRVATFDGRETAPEAATADRFLGPDGKPLAFYDAVVGARSVGVPGVLRMLELAHARYGKLPWAKLFAPAINLAETGVPVSPRLHSLLAKDPFLARYEPARSYFYGADGAPKTVLLNPELAATLRLVAEGGADAFYTGPIAGDIVAALRAVPGSLGDLGASDLAGYAAKERAPVCGEYRAHRLCGMGPPSSGAATLLEMLGLLGHFNLASDRPPSAAAVHLLAEAGRLAYADRARYLADSDFVAVPVSGLLDPDYLTARAQLIDRARAMPGPAPPGDPPGSRAEDRGDNAAPELPSTSHISIIDRAGNALASWCAASCSTTSSRISRSCRRSRAGRWRTASPAASGRSPPWRRRWSSIVTGASSWWWDRPAAAPSSTTSPRRSSPCSIGATTLRRRSTCPMTATATARPRSRRGRAPPRCRPRSPRAAIRCG